MIVTSPKKPSPMVSIKSGLARVVRRYPHNVLLRLVRTLSASSATSGAFALDVVLATAESTPAHRASIDRLSRRLPARDVVSALTSGRSSLTRTRIDALSSAVTEPVAGLDYAQAVLERRFTDAYEIWREIPEVTAAMANLPVPPSADLARSMAVVLPGPADSRHGRDINDHDLVARTTLSAPSPHDAASIGTRCDVAFVNVPRYRDLCASPVPIEIGSDRLVTDPRCRRTTRPPWLTVPVEFDLTEVVTPAAPHSYITMRIVQWCHARDLRPTLYFADFYLSQMPYQSSDYDPSRRMEEDDVIIRYYLTHDVFFTHGALQKWRSLDVIGARGRLDELLDLDGPAFARAMVDRWGSRRQEEDR